MKHLRRLASAVSDTAVAILSCSTIDSPPCGFLWCMTQSRTKGGASGGTMFRVFRGSELKFENLKYMKFIFYMYN